MLLLLFACNPSYPPELPLDSELTACDVDGDCVLVELGLCDACNGGFAVATNVESEDFVRRRYSERSPFGHACTAMGCAQPTAICEAQTCAIGPPEDTAGFDTD